jgi:nicotinamide riboside transporter PnuC
MMLSIAELRKYDWISFYDCRSNIKDKKSGAKVGRYMAISGYDDKWRIYQIYGGLPVIDVWITSLTDAVKIAGVIEKTYGEYLAIWEIWTDVNVVSIARLSVDGGEKLYNALCELELLNRPVNYNDFMEKMK